VDAGVGSGGNDPPNRNEIKKATKLTAPEAARPHAH
jgi:hypothetical protein